MFSPIFNFFRVNIRDLLLVFNIRVIKISLTEKMLLKFCFKNKNVKFLQLGANDGVSFDCLYEYATTRNWSGIVVEPLSDFYQKLSMNYEAFPRIKPVNIAIHPYAQSFDLYRVDPEFHKDLPDWVRGAASFSYENLLKQGIKPNQIISNSVLSIPLMKLVEEYDLYDIDYLQIDVEGMDGEIIRMIDFDKVKPKLIRFEWKHMMSSEISEIEGILVKRGYFFKKDDDEFFAFKKDAL